MTRVYGSWAGNPKGHPEDPERCIEKVYGPEYLDMIGHQCTRKRGHGKDGLYCKQHAKIRSDADERK